MDAILVILLFVVLTFLNNEIEQPIGLAAGFAISYVIITTVSSLFAGHPDYFQIILMGIEFFLFTAAYFWLLKKLSGWMWWLLLFGGPFGTAWIMQTIYLMTH